MTRLFTEFYQNIFYPILPNVLRLIRQFTFLCLLLCLVFALQSQAIAADFTDNLLKQPPREITISLGNSANELKFEPDHLEFVPGKRYLLHLNNPSQLKHYFTAKDFADSIWTQKVEAGKVEVKGAIHELELKPGAEAQWFFVPIKPGKYSLNCSIAGHTAAGMTGEIAIQ
ncbi:copper-binding protein [Anabaenopsis tanganyikae CS-531]|uniref:Copper-binding protein n=2 Tax=Anabaenopsis TaxID=110103 RepID=A0ABT5AQM3_9CYAN|nr:MULTISPECIES: plastocyanin/azurin family copper-binding protein [Anabaenopsis]MDB9539591.1 copper-binding protein [Anabaenopsis arnoldii]MDH6091896.1 copper-binding protein [Anabaenopsis arnoldii]MDH6106068.1 copper-binding protein [Anabaenopsis tanganyikae CS-531]